MTTRILALIDDDQLADEAAKAVSELGYEELEWQFINSSSADTRIMPGVPAQHAADTTRPVGFIAETDSPTEYTLDGLDLSDEEKEFYSQGIERSAVLMVVDAPDEAVDEVERVLSEHNASRFMET
jgi:hypothetical protein